MIKVNVDRKALLSALNAVSCALAKPNKDSLLHHLMLQIRDQGTGEHFLTVTATNRTLVADCSVPVEREPGGAEDLVFGLHGSQFHDLIKQADDDHLSLGIDLGEQQAVLTFGDNTYGLDPLVNVPYPFFRDDASQAEYLFEVTVKHLQEAFGYIKGFLAPAEETPSYRIAELRNHNLIAGTNRRIGIYHCASLPGAFKIDHEGIAGALAWMKHLPPDSRLKLSASAGRYYLSAEDAIIGWPIPAVSFPEFENRILNDTPVRYTATLDTHDLQKTVGRLALMLPGDEDKVDFNFETSSVRLSVNNGRGKLSHETLSCQRTDHAAPPFSLNSRFLLDTLPQFETGTEFRISDRFLMLRQEADDAVKTAIIGFKVR